LYELFVALKVP